MAAGRRTRTSTVASNNPRIYYTGAPYSDKRLITQSNKLFGDDEMEKRTPRGGVSKRS